VVAVKPKGFIKTNSLGWVGGFAKVDNGFGHEKWIQVLKGGVKGCLIYDLINGHKGGVKGPLNLAPIFFVSARTNKRHHHLMKQKKKWKICFVIYIAGERFFFIYDVIVNQKIKKRSTNHYYGLPE
jgi:hypothetical protein